ncbi:peroxiredoxin [Pseudogemmobacter sonorensis]|uniref:peroxiredoxin n=1 Tax=Pseudogemmobacter sonorensis TaxID=2989681 RepID=UPI00368B482E
MSEITVGSKLPEAKLLVVGANGPEAVELGEKLRGRKVVIFGLPGAYTGTCSTAHVPSFIRTAGKFAEKGVDEIICIAVNDPFVMKAWGEATGATAAGITFLSDADGGFAKAVGLSFDAPPAGLFGRSKRYALLAEDGVVKMLHLEASPGQCEISGGETLLDAI